MRVSIFGLGYVGVVAAGCLADEGHTVVGVDPNPSKVALLAGGKSPIVETGIEELIAAAVAAGRLSATSDGRQAVFDSDISLVCVGTPSAGNGASDLTFVRRVCEEIGAALREKQGWHLVVIRSTVLPQTMRTLVLPTLEAASGKQVGEGFGLCNNPEFLREGSAIADYRHPPKTVIGEADAHSGETLASLYTHLDAPLVRTSFEVAEAVKFVDNTWHALKVAFANEIGAVCKAGGIDSHDVMDIFCLDTKLNISPYYLKPAYAFGGSCLPKDVRALCHKAQVLDVEVPLLRAIMPSNREHVDRGLDLVRATGAKRVGVLGFSFKAGSDDLRESPLVELIERLIGKGHDVRLYDRNVQLAALGGANRDFILNQIPHISQLMADSIDDVLDHGEVIVIGNSAPEFREITPREGQTIVDLVRIDREMTSSDDYHGICW